jgi:glycosyltransferase involved in cell wall biosynthesis
MSATVARRADDRKPSQAPPRRRNLLRHARKAGGAKPLSITVLVPTFRRPTHLSRCLASLATQERPPDEVIVVVRQDDHESLRVVDRVPAGVLEVRRATVCEPGVVAALRTGLDAVRGDVVAITDDDVVALPDWLARVESHFRADATLGAVGGRDWLHQGDRVLDDRRREVGQVRWYGRVIGNHHLGVGPPRAVHILKGANMSFRSSALADIRPDPRLFGQGAQVHFEVGMCLALARRRWTVLYDPAVAVHHFPGPRFDEDARDGPSLDALANETHNEMYLLVRWLPLWRKPFALAYGVLVGYRRTPGLALLLERIARERSTAVVARFWAAERGRVKGILTALVQLARVPEQRRGGARGAC